MANGSLARGNEVQISVGHPDCTNGRLVGLNSVKKCSPVSITWTQCPPITPPLKSLSGSLVALAM